MHEGMRIAKLAPPTGTAEMVLDTDTYTLLSRDKLDVKAIYAAPFHNPRSSGPGDGMERSYEEILRLLDRLGVASDGLAFRGSTSYLPGAEEGVRSPAAEDLVERAMAGGEAPLYVLAVGAITNVAAAILLEPKIIERIVVVWLGGQPLYWPSAREFNLQQDPHASRLIFDCGVPLVHIPCSNVAEHLRTTVPEMERYVKGQGAIGDYLFDIFLDYQKNPYAWSKVIWDISTVAWLVNASWIPTVLEHSPILTSQLTWSLDRSRHLMRSATRANRDAVFGDLFRKLESAARGTGASPRA